MEIVIRGDTADELRENILAIAQSYKVPRKVNPKSGGKYGYHDIYAEEYKKIYDELTEEEKKVAFHARAVDGLGE